MKKIFFILFFLFSFVNMACAQLFINQAKMNIAINRGETSMGSFYVQNTTNEAIPVRVYWEDFDYVSPFDGTKNFIPAGTGKFSANHFVTFSPQEFELPAFGKQNIEYLVKTPADFEQGHYGVMFFEQAGDPIRDVTGVQIVTRVGTLFFIEPKEPLKKANFTEIQIIDDQVQGDFINHSNITLLPQMSYYILDEEGNMLDRNYLRNLYLPQGEKANWNMTLAKDLPSGILTLMLNADLGDGDIVIKEIDFVKDNLGQIQIKAIRD